MVLMRSAKWKITNLSVPAPRIALVTPSLVADSSNCVRKGREGKGRQELARDGKAKLVKERHVKEMEGKGRDV